MQDLERTIDSAFAWIAAGIVVVIIYGSLFPFHFQLEHTTAGPFRRLLDTWRAVPGRGDLLANILLYAPYGLFSVPVLRRWSALPRILLVVFGGMTLSAALELAQFYLPGRIPALSDVYANAIGALLGSVAGGMVFGRSHSRPVVNVDLRPFVVLLLACWLGYRLFPYAPTIDLHKYWTAIKPLIFSPSLPPLDFYRHTVVWLAVALLLEAMVGTLRSRAAMLLLAFFVLGARIFILDALLSPAEVGGAVLAAVAWCAILWRLRIRAHVVAAFFVALVVIQALDPFQFSGTGRSFEWIPFAGLLHGSLAVNIRSFLEKSFTYGALLWLLARAGCNWAMATSVSAGLVLSLRLVQVFLPGRSAEFTDVVMVLFFAGAMKLLAEDPARPAAPVNDARAPASHSLLLSWYERLTCNDPVQPANMIFVAAGRMERKHFGLELYRAGVAPRLVLSVGRFEISKMGSLDTTVGAALVAERQAIPPEERHFFVELNASGMHIEKAHLPRWSTYGEALALRRLLEGTGIRKVIVVSSDLHLRRVALTYEHVLRGLPVDLLYCPVPERFGPPAKRGWWTRAEDRSYVAKETLKLAGYRLILLGPGWATPWLMRLKA